MDLEDDSSPYSLWLSAFLLRTGWSLVPPGPYRGADPGSGGSYTTPPHSHPADGEHRLSEQNRPAHLLLFYNLWDKTDLNLRLKLWISSWYSEFRPDYSVKNESEWIWTLALRGSSGKVRPTFRGSFRTGKNAVKGPEWLRTMEQPFSIGRQNHNGSTPEHLENQMADSEYV